MRIVIDGETNLVTLEESVVSKTVALDDFLGAYSANQPMTIPFLPGNCVGMFSMNGKTCFIIKRDPGIYTMLFQAEETYNLRLMFPHTYYAITVTNAPISIVPQSCYMFFSKEPVSKLDSEVGYMEMPNVSIAGNIGRICTGSIEIADNMLYHHAINDIVAKLINNTHNNDLFDVCFSPFIKEAMKQHTPAKLKKIEEGDVLYQIAQGCIRHNTDKFKYLYTWCHMSQTMTLTEFMQGINFHCVTNYGEAMKEVAKDMGALSW